MRTQILILMVVFLASVGRAEKGDERATGAARQKATAKSKPADQWACEEALNHNSLRGPWPPFQENLGEPFYDTPVDAEYSLKDIEKRYEMYAPEKDRRVGSSVVAFPSYLTKAVCNCLKYNKAKAAAESLKTKMEGHLRSRGEKPSIGCDENQIS